MTINAVSNGVADSSVTSVTKRKPKSKNNRLNHRQSFDLTKWVLDQSPKSFTTIADMSEKGSKALGFPISPSSITYMASQHEIDLRTYLKERRTISSPSKKVERLAAIIETQGIQIVLLSERITKLESLINS